MLRVRVLVSLLLRMLVVDEPPSFFAASIHKTKKIYGFLVGGGRSRVHAEARFRAYSHGWRSKSGDVRLEHARPHFIPPLSLFHSKT